MPSPTNIDELTSRAYRWRPLPNFGVVLEGPKAWAPETRGDYLNEELLQDPLRDAFLDFVEAHGLVVCKHLEIGSDALPSYRSVPGKSRRLALSQGELYHHDGCSKPERPRVVEIRFPYQDSERWFKTAVAPFRKVVAAMLDAMPHASPMPKKGFLHEVYEDYREAQRLPDDPRALDRIQGEINRWLRRSCDTAGVRRFFARVDEHSDAYLDPWEMGESRLIANRSTMQHRRVCPPEFLDASNGSLQKRWPAERDEPVSDTCSLSQSSASRD